MRTEKIDEKRDSFKSLLFKLALSQMTLSSNKEKSEVYIELEKLYDEEEEEIFRHFYSDIFAVLSLIDKDPTLGNLEILSQNMDIVRQGYQAVNKKANGEPKNISKQINKLYDHVNLEIARMNYFKENETRTKTEMQKVSKTLNTVEDNIKQMEETVEKADEMQKQYITILGIFASIVLAFTGGIAFSTSILENISKSSVYRISGISIILAWTLINVIYVLTRFISEISKKKNDNIKYPKYMIVLNIVCAIALIIVVAAWAFDLSRAVSILQEWLY